MFFINLNLHSSFTLKDCLFGDVRLAKNAVPDKYVYSSDGIGFDLHSEFSLPELPDGSVGKNVIIFGVDMSSSDHDKDKDVLIFGKGPTQGWDNTTLTAEAKYPINFSRSNKKPFLSLHYNGSNSFSFVNAIKLCQFKAKNSEIWKYLLCLRNISGDFSANNIKIKLD